MIYSRMIEEREGFLSHEGAESTEKKGGTTETTENTEIVLL
jgi:hypothetical protein